MNFRIKQTAPLLPSGCSLIAKIEDERIGYAHITVSQTVATLTDIQVSDFRTRPFMLFPLYRKTYKYRGKGVGTALLKRVIALCEEARMSEILGRIHGDEEMLKVWYEKYGFKVSGKEIRLNLKNTCIPNHYAGPFDVDGYFETASGR